MCVQRNTQFSLKCTLTKIVSDRRSFFSPLFAFVSNLLTHFLTGYRINYTWKSCLCIKCNAQYKTHNQPASLQAIFGCVLPCSGGAERLLGSHKSGRCRITAHLLPFSLIPPQLLSYKDKSKHIHLCLQNYAPPSINHLNFVIIPMARLVMTTEMKNQS